MNVLLIEDDLSLVDALSRMLVARGFQVVCCADGAEALVMARRRAFTTILGPSGCSKTTTLRMIAGLESPSGGQIFIDDVEVTKRGPAERNVSMVFQSDALFPRMNVMENVSCGLSVSGVKVPEIRERAHVASWCPRTSSAVGFWATL